jgi:hypothetical protein
MSKKPQFQVFRYQILPIAREFQTDLFRGFKTLEQLLSNGRDIAVRNLKRGHVRAEIGGRLAGPNGFVIGAVGDVEARANHIHLVL